MRSPVRESAIALAAVALLASCTAGPTAGDGSPAGTGSPTRKALDLTGDPRAVAPLAFDSKAAHVLPTGPADDRIRRTGSGCSTLATLTRALFSHLVNGEGIER